MKFAKPAQAPTVAAKPRTFEEFGHRREDPYFWLREKENPDVRAYIEAENAYVKEVLQPFDGLQTELFEEMKSRLEPEEVGVPVKRDDYFYGYRIPEGKQYPVYFRRRGSEHGPEEVTLDVNELARGSEYFAASQSPSPDHRLLAYAFDDNGSERYAIRVKNLVSGQILTDHIPDTGGSLAWAQDAKNFFYVKRHANDRPYQVWLHRVGSHFVNDQLLFTEDDAKFFVGLSRSKDGRYVFVQSNAKITGECWAIDTRTSLTDLRPVHLRKPGVEIEDVDHWNGTFLVLTNDREKNFRLVQTPVAAPSLENSEEILRGGPDLYIESFEVTRDYWIVSERKRGLHRIRVRDLRAATEHFIEMDEPTYALSLMGSAEFVTGKTRFAFSSPRTAQKIYDYDLQTREKTLKKDTPIGGGFRPENYATERIFVTSHDGTQVPVSLLYRKDLDRTKPAPVLLYGYGSYGYPMVAGMSTVRFSLVDRGFIWAIAHIRGGSDLGRTWYEDGKFLKKKNTFHDFIAAAEGLVAKGYAQKGEVSIMGGSAGGMLVGACMNMRPDLFKCVVGDVPFVDVINTMLDDTLMLTVTEYDEWGNPHEKEFYEYMLSYSPYDNLKRTEYPHVFLSAGWNDPRVTYWEPAKFAARLRDLRTDDRLTVLYTVMGAGHGGASGRFDALKERAMHFAFILGCYRS